MNGVSSHWVKVATISWIPKQIVVLGAARQIIAAGNIAFLAMYDNLQNKLWRSLKRRQCGGFDVTLNWALFVPANVRF